MLVSRLSTPITLRTIVEEHMKQDAELAERVRLLLADNFAQAAPPVLPPELELRSLRRTQRLLGAEVALWFASSEEFVGKWRA
jgi:hypothetical protein